MFARMREAAYAAAFVTFSAAIARIDSGANARVLFDRHVAGLPHARLMGCDRARQAMDFRARRAAALSQRETKPSDLHALADAVRRRKLRGERRQAQVAAGGWLNASRALSGC